jgi:hypothetical protein
MNAMDHNIARTWSVNFKIKSSEKKIKFIYKTTNEFEILNL